MGLGSYWLRSLGVQGAQPHQEGRLPVSRARHGCTLQWPFGEGERRETQAIKSWAGPWDSRS